MSKYQYAMDTYEFPVIKPSYDEVKSKMADLKEKGWTRLQYEEGYKHIGRDPFDNDYTRNARINGVRKAVKKDYANAFKQYGKEMKSLKQQLKDSRKERDELDSQILDTERDITKLSKEMSIMWCLSTDNGETK